MRIEVRFADLLAIYRAELLQRTAPFWLEHAIDWEHGGILTCISDEGEVLSYAIVASPAHGSLDTSLLPVVTYTPEVDYSGPDSFTFKVNDGTVDSGPATVSVTINVVNDPPTATGSAVATNENTPYIESVFNVKELINGFDFSLHLSHKKYEMNINTHCSINVKQQM